ncbi:MAG: M48 family metallopeptidase [Bacteroidota bacterium]
METVIQYDRFKTARARIREGKLLIRIPARWPESAKKKAILHFERWGATQPLAPLETPEAPSVEPEAFRSLVERINRETLGVPLQGVRLGKARYSRLAQANIKTGVLTFSRYAVGGMPERALRYLILHELAHLVVPNHSSAFWKLVARHEPDFLRLRKVAQSHFRQATQ